MSDTKPNDRWKVRPIVEVAQNNSFMDGDWILTEDLSRSPNGVRLIQLGNIGEGEFIDDSRRWISEQTLARLGCTVVKAGDILVSRMADPIARACIVPDFPYPCITAVDCTIVRVDESRFDRRFVAYLFNSEVVRTQAVRFSTGATRKRISRRNLERVMVPVPSLTEQQRISSILDRVMALRKMREQAAQLASKTIQSLFLKMFGDPFRNPNAFPSRKLEKCVNLVNGKAFKSTDWTTHGKKIIRIQNLNDVSAPFNYYTGKIEEQYLVQDGDLLLAWSGTPGTSFGAHMWTGGEAVLNQHIHNVKVMTPDLDKLYLQHFLNAKLSELISKAHGGVGLQHVTKRELNKLDILIPQIGLQKKFGSLFENLDSIRQRQAESAKEINKLFNSLMNKAFRGELRSAS